MRDVHDYSSIEAEYITTDLSYRQLSEKHSVSCSSLSKYATKYKWAEKRKKYRQSIVTKTVNKESSKQADKLSKLITAADNMAIILERTTDSWAKEELTPSSVMKDIASTLKDLTSVIRNLNGIPTQAEAEAQRIAAERLKLEQRKADADDTEDKTFTVDLGNAEKYSK